MDPTGRRARATSFGPAAELYDQVRPPYPVESVRWALQPLGPGAWRVADIGAGTGIMTRLIIAAGHHAVAVEPDARMRERFAATTPRATVVEGSAESMPLPTGGLDGAVAAQAYHWFDQPKAHAELERVLRDGGVFAAVWNDRDEAEPWVREYSGSSRATAARMARGRLWPGEIDLFRKWIRPGRAGRLPARHSPHSSHSGEAASEPVVLPVRHFAATGRIGA
jgi:SAM-dependent methyltransferase